MSSQRLALQSRFHTRKIRGLISIAPYLSKTESLPGHARTTALLNGQILFSGIDAAGNYGLWATNGTAAGTHEITGISNAFSLGLFHGLNANASLVAFNNEVLFDGMNAAYHPGLWVTDGTAAGTHELTGISGAGSGGLFAANAANVAVNPDFTVFGGEVLFNSVDAASHSGLWVTDGTAAGTHELTGISGASASGINPAAFTVFNNEVFFNGVDAAGHNGLWVTNGTASGTHELTGISGASPSGIDPGPFTVFKGELTFAGIDAAGHDGLWVSNGTVAGTHELNIKGADAGGLTPSNFAVLDNEVIFRAVDSSGVAGLWSTNGTVAGTHEITGINGANTGPAGLYPYDLASIALSSGATDPSSFSPTGSGNSSPLPTTQANVQPANYLAPSTDG
jgi:ELWxxDGT repeat protein